MPQFSRGPDKNCLGEGGELKNFQTGGQEGITTFANFLKVGRGNCPLTPPSPSHTTAQIQVFNDGLL